MLDYRFFQCSYMIDYDSMYYFKLRLFENSVVAVIGGGFVEFLFRYFCCRCEMSTRTSYFNCCVPIQWACSFTSSRK